MARRTRHVLHASRYRSPSSQADFLAAGGFPLCDRLLTWTHVTLAQLHRQCTRKSLTLDSTHRHAVRYQHMHTLCMSVLNVLVNAVDCNTQAQDVMGVSLWEQHITRLITGQQQQHVQDVTTASPTKARRPATPPSSSTGITPLPPVRPSSASSLSSRKPSTSTSVSTAAVHVR